MSDDYRPRENDHLVEPMYEALRGGERRSRRWGRWWGIALLGVVVGVVVILWRGC